MVKTILIGNLGNDCVVRETNGKHAINFSVAHSESYKDKEGVKHEKTSWYNCTLWRNNGQSLEIAKYLLKGTKVFIEGKPDASIYSDRGGAQKIDLTITITQIELLGGKPKTEGEQSQEAAPQSENTRASVAADDLPF